MDHGKKSTHGEKEQIEKRSKSFYRTTNAWYVCKCKLAYINAQSVSKVELLKLDWRFAVWM